ncbi:carboxypeptidase A6 [Cajanus cajan]|uniref:Carboxypeptidase A6 n=1 Tax=Cajanus cajan TaxID=3821 RepID=A0A151RZ42_CAJCA|nr:carboxypeptidase A6 [Cajanus cajan]KYP47800.1 Carboxypeptidase A6 [Cajanus cajan]
MAISNFLLFSISFCFLASHQDLLSVNAQSHNLTQSSVTPINYDLYHSSVNLMEEIRTLVRRHPDKLTMETIKAGNKGYGAKVTVVTYCKEKKENDEKSKLRILLSFGQHGRELITTELALRILSILSEEKFLPSMDQASLNSALDNLVIKVVPMENMNGRKLVEAGDLCERRNGRGVDLNRNWSVDWGKKEKDYDPYEENPGIAPFSEPESQIMRKLAISFEPHLWVNVHSGMEALFMPYDHKNTTPDGLPLQRMKSLLEEVNHLHCQERCVIGSGGGSVGYFAHGTATDFMYDIVGVPMAFTFEIYGDETASSSDCFKMFNPTDLATYNRVLSDWTATFFTIFKLVPHQLGEFNSKASMLKLDRLVSIDEYLDGYLMERRNRYGKKMEVLELGMQEIRTYFRLFLLSSVLLMFMFCSRISKSKCTRPIVSAIPL